MDMERASKCVLWLTAPCTSNINFSETNTSNEKYLFVALNEFMLDNLVAAGQRRTCTLKRNEFIVTI